MVNSSAKNYLVSTCYCLAFPASKMGSINKQTELVFWIFEFFLTKLKPRVTIFTIGVKNGPKMKIESTGDKFFKNNG